MYTIKQENCAVVLLYVLIDDTPTLDVVWMCIFVYKNAGVQDFYCAVNHCLQYSTNKIHAKFSSFTVYLTVSLATG